MIHYQNQNVTIRSLEEQDFQKLADAFARQNWNKPVSLFEKYYREQFTKSHYAFVADYRDEPAGYTTLLPRAHTGPFAGKYPEIVDLNVLIKHQRKGIGNNLLAVCEDLASQTSPAVSLGVGLHAGYGAAQRIYIRRGYVPDGSGVWYRDAPLAPYTACINDDDLVLYLCKQLA